MERERYFMGVATLTAQRSTCSRANVGAILVKDKRIISTGYNGAPPGMPHCDHSHLPDETPCTNAIHAEKNAIAFAARHGVAVEGSQMYCSHAPCLPCAQLMLAAGIIKVTYLIPYRDPAGIELLDNAGLELVLYD